MMSKYHTIMRTPVERAERSDTAGWPLHRKQVLVMSLYSLVMTVATFFTRSKDMIVAAITAGVLCMAVTIVAAVRDLHDR